MSYTVNISISAADVSRIWQAGQAVMFAKPMFGAVTGAKAYTATVVGWIAFLPYESNQVSWEAAYYAYATTSPMTPGTSITVNSTCPQQAQTGMVYLFENGVFTAQKGSGEYIFIRNMVSGPLLSFGLVQTATVNHQQMTSPVNAIMILYHQEATFTPEENVYIFLASSSSGGTILQAIPQNALAVPLTAQSPTANVGYNGSGFFLLP
jgi:hypothetical protein